MQIAVTTHVPTDLVSVGYITGAYGVQGWVKIHPYSNDASALLHAKTWWLTKSEPRFASQSDARDVEKLEAKRHGDSVVARVVGVVGRDAAESLKGTVIQISRSHFPVLSDNEFYWHDLIGLTVENRQGESLGVVADLIDNGAHSILRVTQPKKEDVLAQVATQANAPAREYLIPFVDQFVLSVDQNNKNIIVDWGLDY